VSAPTNAPATGSVDAPLAGAASAGSGAQAAPAAAVAGLLPQTGAAADLLLWAILGLAMLILGLGLVTGRRREGMTGRLRGQGVAQTS
jgi:LPXTG-motif cell wall-anchored protein